MRIIFFFAGNWDMMHAPLMLTFIASITPLVAAAEAPKKNVVDTQAAAHGAPVFSGAFPPPNGQIFATQWQS